MEKKLECVKKRDGRTVPFDRQKIADAIFKAAQSVGGQDRYLADDLAEAVRLYLVREYKGDVPSVEDIQDVVERILIKTGHAKTAKAYILYRQKRARARQLREGFSPEDLSEREHERAVSGMEVRLPVRRSDDNVSLWDKNRIVDALVRETSLPGNIAELIVMEVEEELMASKARRLSSSLIREMVNAKLIQYGFEKERRLHARLGLPFYDVNAFFRNSGLLPDELSMELGRAVKREFAMSAVLPDAAVEKHLRGEWVLCNREGIDRCYSAFIPVPDVPAGQLAAEMSRLMETVGPFIENSLVLSLPDSVCLSAVEGMKSSFPWRFGVEVPLPSSYEDFLRDAESRKIPVSFRIDSSEQLERFAAISGRLSHGGTVAVYPFDPGWGGSLVLNRVILNSSMAGAYAERSGFPPADYLKTFIPLCTEMLRRQEAFISGNRAGGEFPGIFGKAERTVEMEFGDVALEGADFPADGGFISEMLDNSLSFVAAIPAAPASRDRFFSCLHSLLADRGAGKRKAVVRTFNA